jgi:hypothetical protein
MGENDYMLKLWIFKASPDFQSDRTEEEVERGKQRKSSEVNSNLDKCVNQVSI